EPVKLHNLARVADTDMMRDILRELGVTLVATGPDAAVITATDVGDTVPDAMGRRMRASIVLMGALIARAGAARVPKPGGDQIGARRVEMHVRGLRAMGAEIAETSSSFIARSPEGRHGTPGVRGM